MNEFTTILKDEMAEIVEKKSKFIANIFYVENVEEAEAKVKEVKRKYYDAKHNCIAYRVIENGRIVEKSSDDGEPSGTAGGPMLNILQKNNIEKSIKVSKIEGIEIQVRVDYAKLDAFKYYCRNNEIDIVKIEYKEDIVLKIEMEKSRKNIFLKNIETKTLNIKEYQVIQEKYITKTVEKNK